MTNKIEMQGKIQNFLSDLGIGIKCTDFERPWGGFFVIAESDTNVFIDHFYPEMADQLRDTDLPLSPKILCVAPHQRLSWQYHHRRSELWKLIQGEAGYIASDTDHQGEITNMVMDEILELAKGERHRLIGLENWGIIAEIWRHTDANNPSNEDDIIRLQDDFGR